MIKPTVGRVVWFRPHNSEASLMALNGEEPLAAIIAKVWSDTLVNLSVIDANGHHHPRTSVQLRQEGAGWTEGSYCEWMPYQIGQAKANESPAVNVPGLAGVGSSPTLSQLATQTGSSAK